MWRSTVIAVCTARGATSPRIRRIASRARTSQVTSFSARAQRHVDGAEEDRGNEEAHREAVSRAEALLQRLFARTAMHPCACRRSTYSLLDRLRVDLVVAEQQETDARRGRGSPRDSR